MSQFQYNAALVITDVISGYSVEKKLLGVMFRVSSE